MYDRPWHGTEIKGRCGSERGEWQKTLPGNSPNLGVLLFVYAIRIYDTEL